MGIYPEVSLKLARRRRDEARKLLARDIDPSAYRKEGPEAVEAAVGQEQLRGGSRRMADQALAQLVHGLGSAA